MESVFAGFNRINYEHFSGNRPIRTIEMHTGGEPLRIFVDGLPEMKGKTILEKRR